MMQPDTLAFTPFTTFTPVATAPAPDPDPDTSLWAIRIADECMQDQVLCHGVPLGESTVGLVDSNCHEVEDLERADPALQEAFRWLSHRGLARLERDQHGAKIVLIGAGPDAARGETEPPAHR